MDLIDDTKPAPRGYWYRCSKCGMRSLTLSGRDANGSPATLDEDYGIGCPEFAELVASESTVE